MRSSLSTAFDFRSSLRPVSIRPVLRLWLLAAASFVLCLPRGWALSEEPNNATGSPAEKAAAPNGKAQLVRPLSEAVKQRCLEVLRDGLKGDEFWPAIHAAEALTLAGRGDEVQAFLEPKLKTERDDQKRCGLARELVRAGDRAKAAVMLDILAGEDPHGHVHACESLYKVVEIGDGKAMRRAFAQEKNAAQQMMAAGALGRCGNLDALRFLRKKLQDSDPQVSRIAAWLLGVIGDSSDIPQLHAAAKRTDDPLARAYFEHALAVLGDKDGLQALARNLKSDDTAIRTYAAEFAGHSQATMVGDQLEALLGDSNVDVRVRAAQSLLVLDQQPPADRCEEIVRDVYPATNENPRYSEGSILASRDGTLLYATTEFAGSGSDFAAARIVARTSSDGGRTWNEPRVLQENIGKKNVMSVTLRRLAGPVREETPIGLFYLVKNAFDDLKLYLRISHDEARTFGDSVLVSNQPGYHVMNNDRVTLLSTGRLLAPVATTEDVGKVNHFVSSCFLSDDGGKTWRAGGGKVDLPKRGAMEPEVLELDDGRVAMILRTQLGDIYIAHSADGGDTWSEPVSWNVRSPESPATLRRIPATGDLLLIWNDNYTPGAGHGGKRTPLTAAVSTDEGRTWKHVRNLETSPDHTYAYTSLTFVNDRAVLSYYVGDEQTGRISSRFRSLPVSRFYETSENSRVSTKAETIWKAGTAATVITPEKPMWMAGYGGRDKPAEGKLHDLWLKALALEDAAGHRAVVVSSDTLGISQPIYNATCAALQEKLGLERSQIMFNSSHTHCGPVLRGALSDIYPLDDEQQARVFEYSAELEKKIVETVERAFANLAPARLSAGQGSTDFAVNRRNNLEPDVPALREKGELKGPVDHSVPVLAVHALDGTLKAVVFGYACHNTTLSFYQWCGDYAGFAQMELEKRHPGAVAMFHSGCGADQNPLPRRTVELCENYGRKLAGAVDQVLEQSLQPLEPTLATAFESVELRLGEAPTREELEKLAKGSGYSQRWASRLLKQLDAGEPFLRAYPYPVQVWKLGEKQLWITLGGEVVVDYSLGLKKEHGQDVWVTGYCNDVMAYIPSLRVLEEDVPPRASSRWGYEGNTSMMVYGLPAHRWADDIEERITTSVRGLVKQVTAK